MHQLTLNLSPADGLEALERFVTQDAEIDRLTAAVDAAKIDLKDLKEQLAGALQDRAEMSRQVRQQAAVGDDAA